MILPPSVNGWYQYGWLPAAKHRGEFKFWPQVYELWYTRRGYASADYSQPEYSYRAFPCEMERHCSRRQ